MSPNQRRMESSNKAVVIKKGGCEDRAVASLSMTVN